MSRQREVRVGDLVEVYQECSKKWWGVRIRVDRLPGRESGLLSGPRVAGGLMPLLEYPVGTRLYFYPHQVRHIGGSRFGDWYKEHS